MAQPQASRIRIFNWRRSVSERSAYVLPTTKAASFSAPVMGDFTYSDNITHLKYRKISSYKKGRSANTGRPFKAGRHILPPLSRLPVTSTLFLGLGFRSSGPIRIEPEF